MILGLILEGMDPISVYGRQLDWTLNGIPAGFNDPGLAMATVAYGILYMIIITGTPALVILLYLAWKYFLAYMKEIQVHPEDR